MLSLKEFRIWRISGFLPHLGFTMIYIYISNIRGQFTIQHGSFASPPRAGPPYVDVDDSGSDYSHWKGLRPSLRPLKSLRVTRQKTKRGQNCQSQHSTNSTFRSFEHLQQIEKHRIAPTFPALKCGTAVEDVATCGDSFVS